MSQQQEIPQRKTLELDPDIIEDTLVDRITKDCLEAMNHIPTSRIFGCLEAVKLVISFATLKPCNCKGDK